MGEWGGVMNVLLLRPYTTFVLIVFSTSLHTLHVTLDTSSLLHCTHFMLRWIRLLYFFAHTSCYVGYVLSRGVGGWGGVINVLSLRPSRPSFWSSFLFRCTHFMLRWICLLYFLAHTSCYIGYVFPTSLRTLYVMLDTSSLLPCAHFMLPSIRLLYFLAHTSCNVGYVFSTMSRLGNGDMFIEMKMLATSQPKRWASWSEGKRSSGSVANHKHDGFKNVTILYRNSTGIYEKMSVLLQWELKNLCYTSKM